METQLQSLVKSIVIAQNYEILLKQICEDQIMTNNELLNYVFDHLNEIQNEEKLSNLCQSMTHTYIEKKDFMDIEKKYEEITQTDPFYNAKKKFIKAIVAGIGMKLFIIRITILVIFYVNQFKKVNTVILNWNSS
jgi:hypothetical protein